MDEVINQYDFFVEDCCAQESFARRCSRTLDDLWKKIVDLPAPVSTLVLMQMMLSNKLDSGKMSELFAAQERQSAVVHNASSMGNSQTVVLVHVLHFPQLLTCKMEISFCLLVMCVSLFRQICLCM